MADSRQCGNTEPHKFHGWDEPAPDAPLEKHFHVCPGVQNGMWFFKCPKCDVQMALDYPKAEMHHNLDGSHDLRWTLPRPRGSASMHEGTGESDG